MAYSSVEDLMIWQRVVRREAEELLARHRAADAEQPLVALPIPGAELLCPACSSEARVDESQTVTCGTCGTLSPLDATVVYSNRVHATLHFGVRVRSAMVQGRGGDEIPAVERAFPFLVTRVASLVTLVAVDGLPRVKLDELLRREGDLLRRWVQKEGEQGDRSLASRVGREEDGVDLAQAALDGVLGPLPRGFPNSGSQAFTLEQVFHCAAQYHKMRTSSLYVTYLAEGAALALRRELDLPSDAPLPWRETSPFARALHPNVRAERRVKRYRASEEALARALAQHLRDEQRLLATVAGRHRVMRPLVARDVTA